MQIEAVNRKLAKVVLQNGTVLPITVWLDAEGEECDGYEDAVVCVCGDDIAGWFVVDLTDYPPSLAN